MDVSSDPWEHRRRLYRQLQAVCVGLVTVSSGMVALFAEASLLPIVGAMVAGLVVGVLLVVIAFPDSDSIEPQRSGRRRN